MLSILRKDSIDFPWLVSACFVLVAFSESRVNAQNSVPRWMVKTEQIMEAVRRADLPVEGVKIRIAAPISASAPNPELDVTSILRLNAQAARLRVSCKRHGECVPFFAYAVWPDNVASRLDQSLSGNSHSEEMPVIVGEPVDKIRRRQADKVVSDAESGKSSPFIKSGGLATLLIEEGRIHLVLHVVCLQSGHAGDRVRVTTWDHKQTYIAEVLSPNLLRGNL